MRVEVSETVYYCEYCNQMYSIKEDCLLCEDACKMLSAIEVAVPKLKDAIDNLNKCERYKAANVIKLYKNL